MRFLSSVPIRLAVALIPLLMAACTTPSAKGVKPLATVSGMVTFHQPVTLSPDALVTVQLVDVSRQDVASMVLAEQLITSAGTFPIPFSLSYDPDAIAANHSYAVQARIEWEGQLLFVNNTPHCAITRGCPTKLDVAVAAVGH